MQHSPNKTISPEDACACAEMLLAVAPALMQHLRLAMRDGRGPELSVPQFRVLVHASLRPGASLRQLAEPLGVSTATASRMVESLVLRGLLAREPGTADRRQVAIALTPAGQGVLDTAHEHARAQFASRLAGLDRPELAALAAALRLVHAAFKAEPLPGAGLEAPTADAPAQAAHPGHDPQERP